MNRLLTFIPAGLLNGKDTPAKGILTPKYDLLESGIVEINVEKSPFLGEHYIFFSDCSLSMSQIFAISSNSIIQTEYQH